VLQAKSGVVVSLPASAARDLLIDTKKVFLNYETLVGKELRLPALQPDDHRRAGVVGILFGSYGAEIRYGVLALGDRGPATYGEVSCRLRDVAVTDRVSFLESNSYAFVERHHLTPASPLPLGYRAVWDNRHLLGAVKLAPSLTPGQTEDKWPDLLVQSNATDRGADEFIEAHIYGTFTAHAIQEMVAVERGRLSRHEAQDFAIAEELFAKLRASRG